MSTPIVRVSDASHRLLRDLTEQTGKTTMEVLDRALDAYRRMVLCEPPSGGAAALRADPEAWAEVEPERKLWDATMMNGLEPAERRTEEGRFVDIEDDLNLSRSDLP
jgi:hypothetical protein